MAMDVAQLDGPARPIPARTPAERARRVLTYAILIAASVLFFVPFLWTVSTSLKTLPETTGFNLLPDAPSVRAYREVLTEFDFLRYAANSFFLAGVITLANLILCSIGGYAFARLRFPGREVLFMLVLATLMIPDQLRLVPVFVMLSGWGLVGSFKGYMLIKLVLAANLFFMRQYFLTIPRDFEEAAKLDNAGHFKTFSKVMLPLAGPALAAITILTFQGIWNEFFWPLILLGFGNPDHYTVQLGLAQFSFQYQTLWPELMAASVIAIVPIVVIFLFFQRYFVAGVVASGVKG
ncbi:MAG: multiple sugar transport system permease protein [Gaiellaceae bacterium]|jgi:ABC-type glycerol-3-phosphate transport system permease component|nr:multiple sugar transport system permease protein [Gaiellaceae bacterium]